MDIEKEKILFNSYKNEYKEFGYAVIPSSKNKVYRNLISNLFIQYSNYLAEISKSKSSFKDKLAFRDKSGNPRHIIDVLRDKNSLSSKILKSNFFKETISCFTNPSKRYFFTHSKLSFKTFGKNASWSPHQDNGYKKFKRREGFAVFICLEDMNIHNGALEVFDKSHRLGTLLHKRISESKTGDGQYIIPKELIPDSLSKTVIEAKQGDIIIFHQNCIHMSSQTKNNSRRLAFIFEVEEYNKFKLDDYGSVPIMTDGYLSLSEKFFTILLSSFSPLKAWRYLSRYPKIKNFLRKFLLSPLGLIKSI